VKKAIVSVINDLSTDQRVDRTCKILRENGYEVLLVGRTLPGSVPLEPRSYKMKRFFMLFHKGPLFYGFFNIRLFLFLLFNKADLLVSNDLDTLWPNYKVSVLKNVPLVYDSHEIFCEVPELVNSGWKKRTWERIEKNIVPHLRFMVTVNASIAEYFKNLYGVDPVVVRNVPMPLTELKHKSKESLGLPWDKKMIILQGSGINMHRGSEELVESMKYIDDAFLLILGGGDVVSDLKEYVRTNELIGKVFFLPKMPYRKMMEYTVLADAGVTLDKDTNINYRFSLPNKIFDYIHAGVPVLASSLPELTSIFSKYDIGIQVASHDPKEIAVALKQMCFNPDKQKKWRENIKLAAADFTWEKEKAGWKNILDKIGRT
jgi:glycosyltransferase involved in cell wall biosynthesis